MGKQPKARTPKLTPFKTNGYAPTVTSKAGETKNKGELQQIQKNLGKKK